MLMFIFFPLIFTRHCWLLIVCLLTINFTMITIDYHEWIPKCERWRFLIPIESSKIQSPFTFTFISSIYFILSWWWWFCLSFYYNEKQYYCYFYHFDNHSHPTISFYQNSTKAKKTINLIRNFFQLDKSLMLTHYISTITMKKQ